MISPRSVWRTTQIAVFCAAPFFFLSYVGLLSFFNLASYASLDDLGTAASRRVQLYHALAQTHPVFQLAYLLVWVGIPVTLFALLFNGLLCTGALARTLATRQYRDLRPLTIPVLFVVLVAAFSLLTPSVGNRVLVAAFFGLAGVPVLVLLPLTWRHLHERIWDVTLPLTIIATLAMLLTLTGALVGTVGVWLTVHQLLGSTLAMILSAGLAIIALAQGFARRSLSRVMSYGCWLQQSLSRAEFSGKTADVCEPCVTRKVLPCGCTAGCTASCTAGWR